MSIDVARARRETPGVEHVVHLNNAGASLQPAVVTDAVVEHLRLEERIGGYEAEDAAADKLARTYAAIGELIRADPGEIALTDSATRAWDLAFYALPLRDGQRILTGRAEYNSNAMAMLEVAARTGARIEVVDDDANGAFDVEDLRRRIDGPGEVGLVAMTHVPTFGGLVNPAVEVGRVCRDAGVTYLLDACQSVGQLDLDVTEIGCDLLSGTGRKFLRAPRGTAFLYASDRIVETLVAPFPDLISASWAGGGDVAGFALASRAKRFENFEGSVAGRIGLGVAVDYALGWGMPAIEQRVLALGERLRELLTDRPGVRVHDQGDRRCGIVTFSVDGVPATQVRDRLAAARINTVVTNRVQPLVEDPGAGAGEFVRASVHYFNDDSDFQALLDALP